MLKSGMREQMKLNYAKYEIAFIEGNHKRKLLKKTR